MSNNNSRNIRPGDSLIDDVFIFFIKMAGRLVHENNTGTTIKSAGNKDSLTLSS